MRSFRQSLRALGLEGELIAADLSPVSAAYHLADRAVAAPRFADGQFINKMLEICERHEVKLLVPTVDPELQLYADHAAAFEQIGTRVAISAPEVIELSLDKCRSHQWLAEQGLDVPRQAMARSVVQTPDDWPFPVIAKPRRGHSSRGTCLVRDARTLELMAAEDEYLVQAVAPGQEYTIDVYVDQHHQLRCMVPRSRWETRGGEITKGMTEDNPTLQAAAHRICQALPGPFGVLNIQMFYEAETDTARVIEINPRFGGGYPLSHQAGAPYTQWLIEETLGLAFSARSDGWADGTVMIRYDDAVFIRRSDLGV
jgi:carbamoyl-phosphate synthase large subunit